MIDSFLSSSPQRLAATQKFVDLNDISAAAREAHGLKSSAQTLGALQLGTLCQELEDCDASKPAKELHALFVKLEKAYQEACAELELIRSERNR
jgi:HPt (histidine-containing phosphotransfer) domain-containing protein